MITLSLLYLKRKKSSVVFISISLILSIALFLTGTSILKITNNAVESMFTKTSAPTYQLQYSDLYVRDIELIDWLTNDKDVKSFTRPQINKQIQGNITYFGKEEREIKNQIFTLTEFDPLEKECDVTYLFKSLYNEPVNGPNTGEIWIPNRVAEILKLELGGTISFGTVSGKVDLLITGFTIDPLYNSGFMNPVRVYVAPGELSLYFPLNIITDRTLSVSLSPESDKEEFKKRIYNQLGFSGLMLDQNLFRGSYTMLFNIISGVMLGISAIAIIISMFLISSVTTHLISSEYKHIGIFKTLGYTPNQVTLIFVVMILIIAIISSVLGAIGGYALQILLLKTLASSTGITQSSSPFLTSLILALVVFLPLISLVTYLKSRTAGNIVVTQAIKYGEPAPIFPNKNKKAPILSLLFPFLHISLSSIKANKKNFYSLLITIILVIISFIFSINFRHSMNNVASNIQFWGFVPSDMSISLVKGRFSVRPEYINKRLTNDPRIKHVIPASYVFGTQPATNGGTIQDLVGNAYWYNMDEAGLINVEGRHPENTKEISIAWNTKKRMGLKLGDGFKLILEGLEKNFIITGFYQGINNMGEGFRIRGEVLTQINPVIQPMSLEVKLREGVNTDSLIKELKKEYSSSISILSAKEAYSMITSSGAIINSSMLILLLVLGAIVSVVLNNDMYINIQKQSKFFGILKTQGYTPLELQGILIIKNIFIVLLAIPIGSFIGIVVTPFISKTLLGSMGFVKFPVSIDYLGCSVFLLLLIAFIAVLSYLMSKKVNTISPRNLISE